MLENRDYIISLRVTVIFWVQISVESIFILIICMDSLSNCFILVFLWLTRLFLFSLCKLIHVRVHYFISVFIKDRMTESRLSYISATGLIIAYLDIALEMVGIKSFSYVLLINFKAEDFVHLSDVGFRRGKFTDQCLDRIARREVNQEKVENNDADEQRQGVEQAAQHEVENGHRASLGAVGRLLKTL